MEHQYHSRRDGDGLASSDAYSRVRVQQLQQKRRTDPLTLQETHASQAVQARGGFSTAAAATAGKATRHEHAWPGRCARCCRSWSLRRSRNSRDDLARQPSQLHLRSSRHQIYNQFVTRDHFTMVGKVSERVLAREGKCYAEMRCD